VGDRNPFGAPLLSARAGPSIIGRYCIDIVTQITAVRAALRRVEEEILRDHVANCVEHAIASGNKADQRRKIEELMTVVSRTER
jgi:DNA-binding FrmR family transcriptional regulator